jgi:hypothetical protein
MGERSISAAKEMSTSIFGKGWIEGAAIPADAAGAEGGANLREARSGRDAGAGFALLLAAAGWRFCGNR